MNEEEKKQAILSNEIINLKTEVKATLMDNVKAEVLRDYPQATMKDLEMYRVSCEHEAEDWYEDLDETGGLRGVAEETAGLLRHKAKWEKELALMKQGILTKENVYMRVFMTSTEEKMRDWLDDLYDVTGDENSFRKMVSRLFAGCTSHGMFYDKLAWEKLADEAVDTVCKEHPEWVKSYYNGSFHERGDIRGEVADAFRAYDDRLEAIAED
jgi:hypothetical protein